MTRIRLWTVIAAVCLLGSGPCELPQRFDERVTADPHCRVIDERLHPPVTYQIGCGLWAEVGEVKVCALPLEHTDPPYWEHYWVCSGDGGTREGWLPRQPRGIDDDA